MNEPVDEEVYDVLIVEDDFMVASLHSEFVASVPGFRVVAVAHTARAAMAAPSGHQPDLALLDVYLPDMTGIEFLRQARHSDLDIDVIMITAARDLATVRTAMQRGVVSYLVKPFEYSALGEHLAQYRKTRASLRNTNPADQGEIDRLFGMAAGRLAKELPKGLSHQTAAKVLSLLSSDVSMSATECASSIGISRVSARRYLEYFESSGSAEVSLKYGAGRPERRYRLV